MMLKNIKLNNVMQRNTLIIKHYNEEEHKQNFMELDKSAVSENHINGHTCTMYKVVYT